MIKLVSLFLPGTPVSSTNETDCRNITEILLKVLQNTINKPLFKYTKVKITISVELFISQYQNKVHGNRIGGVMVIVHSSSLVDHGFMP